MRSRRNATHHGPPDDAPINPRLPADPLGDPALARLPGLRPLGPGEWVLLDDASDAQLALRDALVDRPGLVMALPGSEGAVEELGERLLGELAGVPGYAVSGRTVTRPDGARIAVEGLADLARLTPMDLCLMEPRGATHVLTAGALLFPASWRLDEKIGRPLDAIHAPVRVWDADLGHRVGRLFDLLHPDRPLWRMNALRYANPALCQPRGETARRAPAHRGTWLRSERQCLLKLPRSGAAVFSIQTFVVPWPDGP